jgi:hypothetical protein
MIDVGMLTRLSDNPFYNDSIELTELGRLALPCDDVYLSHSELNTSSKTTFAEAMNIAITMYRAYNTFLLITLEPLYVIPLNVKVMN